MTITPGIALVGRIVLVALVLFATETVPVDIMTLRVMVTLMLVEPLTAAMADAASSRPR